MQKGQRANMTKLCEKRSLKIPVFLLFSSFLFPLVKAWNTGRSSAKLVNNGYEGIVIAIHESTNEDSHLLQRIQRVFTQASRTLYEATRRRAYFKRITVLIPTTWRDEGRYKHVRQETFYNADIRVDPRTNPSVPPHNPYVMGSGRCEQGNFMHLTPKYLTDEHFAQAHWGPYDKTIVHEWAHLRWGVKDEYPTTLRDRFYVTSHGNVEATRCSREASGVYQVRDGRTGRYWRCRLDPRTGLYERGCLFVSYARSSNTASFMFRHYLEAVTDFCDNNRFNPSSYHNREAPNNQNRMCKGRSAWEVILSHEDFTNGANRPVDETSWSPPRPTFKFVKEQQKRIALVMDKSGSMKGNRLFQLHVACASYINNVIEDGDWVGLAAFEYKSYILHNLTEIDDKARSSLIASLPKKAEGGTSIGAGLRQGLNVLSQGGTKDSTGGTIVLITDGKENVKPYISTMIGEVLRRGVIVETIGFSRDADRQLADLAETTGGSAFFTSDVDANSLEAPLTSVGAKRRRTPLITVKSENLKLGNKTSYDTTFTIDSTVNKKVNTHISWKIASPHIRTFLTSPSGIRIGPSNTQGLQYNFDSVTQKSIHLKTEAVEVGTWKLVIENPGDEDQQMSIITQATGIAGHDVIDVTGSLPASSLNFTQQKYLELRAEVRKGYVPIINAYVTAIVEYETGDTKVVQLRDTGGGCDGLKNDGIYTAFFSNFHGGNGRYSVDFTAQNMDRKAEYNYQATGLGAPPLNAEEEMFKSRVKNEVVADYFERRKTVGSFTVKGYTTPDLNVNDTIPPSQITDLTVTSVSSEHRHVTMEWTAPGNDFDVGTTHRFDLRYSENFTELFDHFAKARTVLATADNNGLEAYILTGNITYATTSGDLVAVTVRLPLVGGQVYAFGVRAEDDAGNYGERSNIIVANLQYIAPLVDQTIEYFDQENKDVTPAQESGPSTTDHTNTSATYTTEHLNLENKNTSERLNITPAQENGPSITDHTNTSSTCTTEYLNLENKNTSERLNVTLAQDSGPSTTDHTNTSATYTTKYLNLENKNGSERLNITPAHESGPSTTDHTNTSATYTTEYLNLENKNTSERLDVTLAQDSGPSTTDHTNTSATYTTEYLNLENKNTSERLNITPAQESGPTTTDHTTSATYTTEHLNLENKNTSERLNITPAQESGPTTTDHTTSATYTTEHLNLENKNTSERLDVTLAQDSGPSTTDHTNTSATYTTKYLNLENKNGNERLDVTLAQHSRRSTTDQTNTSASNTTEYLNMENKDGNERLNRTEEPDGIPPSTDNTNIIVVILVSSIAIFILLIGLLTTVFFVRKSRVKNNTGSRDIEM